MNYRNTRGRGGRSGGRSGGGFRFRSGGGGRGGPDAHRAAGAVGPCVVGDRTGG